MTNKEWRKHMKEIEKRIDNSDDLWWSFTFKSYEGARLSIDHLHKN